MVWMRCHDRNFYQFGKKSQICLCSYLTGLGYLKYFQDFFQLQKCKNPGRESQPTIVILRK